MPAIPSAFTVRVSGAIKSDLDPACPTPFQPHLLSVFMALLDKMGRTPEGTFVFRVHETSPTQINFERPVVVRWPGNKTLAFRSRDLFVTALFFAECCLASRTYKFLVFGADFLRGRLLSPLPPMPDCPHELQADYLIGNGYEPFPMSPWLDVAAAGICAESGY